jgi:predicted amidohydrolase YtcJ
MTSTQLVITGVPIYVRHGSPAVESVGVANGVVVSNGPLHEVVKLVPGARVLKLEGGAVLPAFVDAHQHGLLVAVDPNTDVLHRCAPNIAGLLDVIRLLVESQDSTSQWLRFHGYEPLALAERRSPKADELDGVCSDRPLHVVTRTYHESSVNSAGLEALGIGRTTPDPDGGRIVRDRRGRPTGVLLESASFLAERASRPHDDWRPRLAAFGRQLLALGITRVGDAAVPIDLAGDAVDVLDKVGVTMHPLLVGTRIDEPAFVSGGTAKVLLDGGEYCHLCYTRRQVGLIWRSAIRAAASSERSVSLALGRRTGTPRRGDDGLWHTGTTLPAGRDFDAVLRAAANAGSSVAVHAVGNGAVSEVLSALAADPGLARSVPLRVEHAMVIDGDLARRLGEAGVPVVVQPGFISTVGHELNIVPVPHPLELLPLRSLVGAGTSLALSSDYPATSLDPFAAISDAVLRRDSTGVEIGPLQRLTITEALHAATVGAANALGADGAGVLAKGSPADLLWCATDPYAVEPEQLANVGVLATWRAGKLVHAGDETLRVISDGCTPGL